MSSDGVTIIAYQDVKSKIANGGRLIDVREPNEVAQGSIPTAINIPVGTLPEALDLEAAAFKERYGIDKPSPADEVVFYCKSGARATRACAAALEHGYTNILNYKGSWQDWSEQEGAVTA